MITIYKTETCGYCKMVTQICDKFNVDYELISLDDNPTKRQELMDITGAMTVPITTNGKDYVVGWNPGKLMKMIKTT